MAGAHFRAFNTPMEFLDEPYIFMEKNGIILLIFKKTQELPFRARRTFIQDGSPKQESFISVVQKKHGNKKCI